MFVDSHCHLDFPDFADADAGRARPHGRGARRRTRCASRSRSRTSRTSSAVAEHAPNLFASVGVHPDSADVREPGGRRARAARRPSEGRRDRRDGPRLLPPRRRGGRRPRVAARTLPHACPRRTTDRQAARDPHARGCRRHAARDARGGRRRGGRRHALLHRDVGRGRGRARPRLPHLAVGHRDVQERDATCRTSRGACRSTAC